MEWSAAARRIRGRRGAGGTRVFVEWVGPDVRVRPIPPPNATVRLPGSKSLTNRYLLCAALADGVSTLAGASLSDDAERMIAGLAALGISTERRGEELNVCGCRGFLPETTAEIDAGNAGTAMRFLAALACTGRGRYRIDGSPRMRERPIGPLVDALCALGAQIGYDGATGFPPLTIAASGLEGGLAEFRAPQSSQFVSAVMMVAPCAVRDVLVRVHGPLLSRPYVAMTLGVMESMGVESLESCGGRFIVPGSQRYRAERYAIEPDASAAAYFWSCAAITGGSVRVAGLTRASRQGDVAYADVLARMGCELSESGDGIGVAGPPRGRLRGVSVDLNEMPDTAQTLAVTALFADGPTHIAGIENLRIKETDRIAALAQELTRLGARVDAAAGSLTIHPPAQLAPASIETYDDHRMAMSFALAGLAGGPVLIRNAGCVSKSFPGFFETLAELAPAER